LQPYQYGKDIEDERPQEDKLEILAPYIAEFVGTFLLVFTAGTCSVAGDPMWNATAIASILTVSIYAVGPVSGGHLNPSVSIACGLTGKAPWGRVIGYIVMQIGGGLLAGLLYYGAFQRSAAITPKYQFGLASAGAVEVAYTAMICFVVLNCATSKWNNPSDDQNSFFALAIGFVVVAGGYACGDISGAVFNPAISIGLDITGASSVSTTPWWLVYCACQVIGAIVGALFFVLCRPEELNNEPLIMPYEPKLVCQLLSEFLGTFMLVLTVGLNIVMKSPAVAWSAAASLMCMIYSLCDVCGGHFNPAVTLAVVLSGRKKCSWWQGLFYIVFQLVAGVIAGGWVTFYHSVGPYQESPFKLEPGLSIGTWAGVFAAETVFTFMLSFVVLAVATTAPPLAPTRQNFQFALAIGSCVTAGGFAIGAVSGGALNPAVAWGIATQSSIWMESGVRGCWVNCIWYSFFELIGGLVAAIIFRITHAHEFQMQPAIQSTDTLS